MEETIARQEATIMRQQAQIDALNHEVVRLSGSRVWLIWHWYSRIKLFLLSPKEFIRKIVRKLRYIRYRVDFLANEAGIGAGAADRLRFYLQYRQLFAWQSNPFDYQELKIQEQYQLWISTIERPRKLVDYQDIADKVAALEYQPLISILMPTYNTDEIFLRKAIFSVINQYYQNWELCIVDDCSTRRIVAKILQEFAGIDERIKVKFAKENGGISIATNAAAEMAEGEFLAFFDHDDELEPEAVYEMVAALNKNKDADYLYSDDDKVDEFGYRFHPQFKPDWNPELLLSYSYTSHFRMMRKSMYTELGGLDSAYDGTQDYELALRLSEVSDKVVHIPKVLYHWRSLPGSTARSSDDKPASLERGRSALESSLRRRGVRFASVDTPFFAARNKLGIFQVNFNSEDYVEKVTIVIPTKDRLDLLERCINSIREKTTYPHYEILVISNNSEDPATKEYLERNEIKYIEIATPEFNFSYIHNLASVEIKSELMLLLNNDTEVLAPDWLTNMVGTLNISPDIGAVGAKLIFPTGTIQHSGVILGLAELPAAHINKLINFENPGYLYYNNVMRDFSAVTAACLLTRTSEFKKMGGFIEKPLSVSYQDVDFCLKLVERGLRVVYNPRALLIHYEGTSRKVSDKLEKQPEIRYMYDHWGKLIKDDPAFNPNLSLTTERYEITS